MPHLSLLFFAWFALMSAHGAHSLEYRHQVLDSGLGALIVSGDFELEFDEEALQEFLDAADVHFVVFNSPGGNPYAAMRVGRLIRKSGLHTVQLRMFQCASACALAFMGGNERMADAGSMGLHRASFQHDPSFTVNNAVSAVQELTADMIAYFAEMDVDPTILEIALKYDSGDMRYLSRSEMQRYRLINRDQIGGASYAATENTRFIQIATFFDIKRAADFVQRSDLRLVAYLTDRQQIAVVLDEVLHKDTAADRLKELKAAQRIPSDAIVTVGRSYQRRLFQ